MDTKKAYLVNATVLPLLPTLLLLAEFPRERRFTRREVDMDENGHLLLDRWLYVFFDRDVPFPQICAVPRGTNR